LSIQNENRGKIDFFITILPKIKQIIIETIKAVSAHIDTYKRNHTFELFGYDFMIDNMFKTYLIEVNTNPCLDITSKFSEHFIPKLIENVLKYTKQNCY